MCRIHCKGSKTIEDIISRDVRIKELKLALRDTTFEKSNIDRSRSDQEAIPVLADLDKEILEVE